MKPGQELLEKLRAELNDFNDVDFWQAIDFLYDDIARTNAQRPTFTEIPDGLGLGRNR